MKLPRLTSTQKQYIWLAGKYGMITQGRGKRSRNGVIEWSVLVEGRRALLHGYQNPEYFLKNAGLLEVAYGYDHSYKLTEHGRAIYERLQAKGYEFGK